MFSKEYIRSCTENEKVLREEWEPSLGDWAWSANKGRGVVMYNFEHCIAVAYEGWDAWTEYVIEDLIPLFTLRQLIEMLEERGYALAHLGDERLHPDFEGRDWNPEEPYIALAQKEPGDYVKGIGPDPETALLRAWLEVVSHGGEEEDVRPSP